MKFVISTIFEMSSIPLEVPLNLRSRLQEADSECSTDTVNPEILGGFPSAQ